MGAFLLRRLIATVLLAFAVATIVFLFIRLVPGDPAMIVAGELASDEQIAEIRRQLGIDKPVLVQYGTWMGNLVQGDFGNSVISGTSVGKDLLAQLPRTLELVVAATVLSVLIGVPLGVISAVKRDRSADLIIGTVALLGLSAPGFVVGTLLVLFISVQLGWLPSSGYVSFQEDPVEHLKLLLLPAIALGTRQAAVNMRYARSALLEVLGQDYVRTARAKGLKETIVIIRHGVRNALIPVVTIVGLEMGQLLGGTVIIETIFSWPGLSSLLFRGISQRDYPVVQGVVLLIALIFILLNLLVDVINALLDPRIRY